MFGAVAPQVQTDASAQRKNLKGRVLVAEDNLTNQKVIVLRLEKLGCTTHVVQNGYEALEATRTMQFDVILMDCQMPVMDGLEATAQIRKDGGRHIPIIALTANAMEGERERCLAAGMDDYLSKPVQVKDLSSKLEHWLGQSPQKAPAAATAPRPADMHEALNTFIRSMEDEGIARDEIDVLFGSFLESSSALMKDLQAAISKKDA
ncbi:MAG TPA: response regulator, partial [Terracidiphilus sp.]